MSEQIPTDRFDGMPVTRRLYNILINEGFKTWDDVAAAQWSKEDWMHIRGIGAKTATEILRILNPGPYDWHHEFMEITGVSTIDARD